MWLIDDNGISRTLPNRPETQERLRWIHVAYVVAGYECLDPNLRPTIVIAGGEGEPWRVWEAFQGDDGFQQLIDHLAEYLPGVDSDWFAEAMADPSINTTIYESDEYRSLCRGEEGNPEFDLAVDPDDPFYQWFDATWSQIEGPWLRHDPTLSERDRTFARLYTLYAEIGHGGLEQYFFHEAGDVAEAVIDDFRKLNRPDLAQSMQDAVQLIGIPYPSDCDTRRALYQDLELHEATFDALDILDRKIFGGWLRDLKIWYDASVIVA